MGFSVSSDGDLFIAPGIKYFIHLETCQSGRQEDQSTMGKLTEHSHAKNLASLICDLSLAQFDFQFTTKIPHRICEIQSTDSLEDVNVERTLPCYTTHVTEALSPSATLQPICYPIQPICCIPDQLQI